MTVHRIDRRTAIRDRLAHRLTLGLLSIRRLRSVQLRCDADIRPGLDEVPDWQVWTDRETTSDQLRIEAELEGLVDASRSILHIGAGNSSLGRRFGSRVRRILGTTIHVEEIDRSGAASIPNYSVELINKYGTGMDTVEGKFDLIVDNNPSSFACCLFHFSRMFVSYVNLMERNGRLITAQPGLGWVLSSSNWNWSLDWDGWREIGQVLGMQATKLNEFVYSLQRGPESDRFAEETLTAGAFEVPILAYHSIATKGPPELRPWRTTPEAFAAQLRLLRRHGYRSISLSEWADCISGQSPPPDGPVVVFTFDDGYKDFLTNAAPLLEAEGFRATMFVVTDQVGGVAKWDTTSSVPLELMTWDDLRLLRDRGFTIASHTTGHRDLTTLSDEEIERDSHEARAVLRRELGLETDAVAFPSGFHNASARAALARGGYRIGVEVTPPRYSTLADDIGCLPRVEIFGYDTIETFAFKLGIKPDGDTAHEPPRGSAIKVHLYAQCWNDAPMLPYFFRHYDSFVDRYVIFDDGSTDGSLEILSKHPKVELRRFVRSDPESFVLSEQALSNACWKESRGEADWVIVTDIDEHLYHPSMREYLAGCARAGVTLIPALGFQMVCEELPPADALLCDVALMGAPFGEMMKPSIFDPNAVTEINFRIGRHTAEPVGEIRMPNRDEVLLLHYKYIGRSRVEARHHQLSAQLGAKDKANRWGHQYEWSTEELTADWEAFVAHAVDVRQASPETYPIDRWWRPTLAGTTRTTGRGGGSGGRDGGWADSVEPAEATTPSADFGLTVLPGKYHLYLTEAVSGSFDLTEAPPDRFELSGRDFRIRPPADGPTSIQAIDILSGAADARFTCILALYEHSATPVHVCIRLWDQAQAVTREATLDPGERRTVSIVLDGFAGPVSFEMAVNVASGQGRNAFAWVTCARPRLEFVSELDHSSVAGRFAWADETPALTDAVGSALGELVEAAVGAILRGTPLSTRAVAVLIALAGSGPGRDSLWAAIAQELTKWREEERTGTIGAEPGADDIMRDINDIVRVCVAGDDAHAIISPTIPFDYVDSIDSGGPASGVALLHRRPWAVPLPTDGRLIRIRLDAALLATDHPDVLEFSGFYPVEGSDGHWYRWTGPGPIVMVTAPVSSNLPMQVAIELANMGGNTSADDFAISCNGCVIPHRLVNANGGGRLTAWLPMNSRVDATTTISMTIKRRSPPQPPEQRTLGVVFRSLSFYIGGVIDDWVTRGDG